ncbi:MAG TPA: hypothetical protein VIY53_00215, partial [Acidobacteriaceae bacterium]
MRRAHAVLPLLIFAAQAALSATTPTIMWAAPSPIPYGTKLSATQLDATASVAGSFAYSPAAGAAPAAGTHTLSVTFTPTDTTDYTTAKASVTLTVNRATPAITWATPTAITYGTALNVNQLDAKSAVAGTFAYAPAAGTVLSVGTHALAVTLTPTNTTDYTTATVQVTLTVKAAGGTLTITTESCPGGTQGAAYAGCTINASGGYPPYTFSAASSANYPPLPEGIYLNATTGDVRGGEIGGEGTYTTLMQVTDSKKATATREIAFAISGDNAFLGTIFPANSIFHHRVDAATTKLPVDTSPAAPMYSGYLPETVKPFFGNES